MKLHVYSLKGYEFKADIDVEDRTEILTALGLPIDYPNVLQIEGTYTVEYDDDIEMPMATLAHILHPSDPEIFVSYEKFGDLADFDFGLEASADYEVRSDWSADRQASLIDEAYDSYGDR